MIEELEESVALNEGPGTVPKVLDAVAEICRRHQITALNDFQESCRGFAQDKILSVAGLGRFKAGKSSLLNHLISRAMLPVGVIPVTSAVTQIRYGSEERGEVVFRDGRREKIPITRIGEFMSETENPGNAKGVARVLVELPAMKRYRGIRFVDTPGLDSVFAHNTDASLDWLPNAGLALVAVGVDPPLSQRDLELIRTLKRYTPRIALLVPIVDLLAEAWQGAESQLLAILRHKIATLLEEYSGQLNMALQAAEASDAERSLKRKILRHIRLYQKTPKPFRWKYSDAGHRAPGGISERPPSRRRNHHREPGVLGGT
jgi:predicted GTPase